jgi:hypothetical protein
VLVACGGPVPVEEPPATPRSLGEASSPLSPVDLLIRASLDLRGVRPSPDELDQVLADPTVVDDLVVGFADDPRLGTGVAERMSEVYWTLDEISFVRLDWYLNGGFERDALLHRIGREPLVLLSTVVDEDLPYTELMTADWTMADDVLAQIWPVSYPDGATGWQRVQYTDGRPAAGVLATNGMWWQHGSMENNLNRGRANAFSRIFLCFDYLDHEVGFDDTQPLDSEAALGDAIRTDPSCAGCHDSLDPIASHFYGFWYYSERKLLPSDAPYYHPEREQLWRRLGGLPPAFKGERTSGLRDLAQRTAADPRFTSCFVEQTLSTVLRRPLASEDRPLVEALLERFRDSGLRVRELYRALVQSGTYREGEGPDGRRLVTPAVLASQIQALTGFRWRQGGRDLMLSPREGYAALAGGVDGVYRVRPAVEPSPTTTLVHARLAEAAAYHVVDTDLERDAPRLLTLVGADAPDDASLRTQLVDLHRRILTEDLPADHADIDAEVALWHAVHDLDGSVRDAWKTVVAALLRDPRLVVH